MSNRVKLIFNFSFFTVALRWIVNVLVYLLLIIVLFYTLRHTQQMLNIAHDNGVKGLYQRVWLGK